jgi:hypothetical protein
MVGKPGASTRQRARRERRWAKSLLILLLILDLVALVLGIEAMKVAGGSLLAIIFVLILWILSDKVMHRVDTHIETAHRADKGAAAEERVARILDGEYPGEFFVINDVMFPGGNIDHVVISRSGAVFTIETKSGGRRVDARGETLLLDGKPFERDPVQQALREAMWVKERLGEVVGQKPYVTAVVLFTDAYVNVRERIRDVNIASLGFLDRILTTVPSATLQRESLWKKRQAILAALAQAQPRSGRRAA